MASSVYRSAWNVKYLIMMIICTVFCHSDYIIEARHFRHKNFIIVILKIMHIIFQMGNAELGKLIGRWNKHSQLPEWTIYILSFSSHFYQRNIFSPQFYHTHTTYTYLYFTVSPTLICSTERYVPILTVHWELK